LGACPKILLSGEEEPMYGSPSCSKATGMTQTLVLMNITLLNFQIVPFSIIQWTIIYPTTSVPHKLCWINLPVVRLYVRNLMMGFTVECQINKVLRETNVG
jgi:hypothetical protein